jgi:hypothetical protein
MKISYNESERSIEIQDGLKNSYLILKILMILNLLNAVARLFKIPLSEYGFLEIFWLVLGVLSLILLYFFVFKKSTSSKIEVDKIKKLKEKSFFGRNRYSLELVDGKQRDLVNFKNEWEFAKVKELFENVGIAS